MSKASTTERGYGWAHQQARERLLRAHKDGAPCPRCHKPMWRDKTKNWDERSLAADHGPGHEQKYAADKQRNPPTRLMHATCNERDGARDKPTPTPAGFNWQTLE